MKPFLKTEAASGICLLFTLVITLCVANSPWMSSYHAFIEAPRFPAWFGEHLSFLSFINEGLMSIFFLLLTVEIKREILVGALSHTSRVILPCLAAIGGIIGPAAVYLLITHQHLDLHAGWSIPTATDVALTLGLVALLGKRVPVSLRLFLVVLAMMDDIVAILIIAIFYTHAVQWWGLVLVAVVSSILGLLCYRKKHQLFLYVFLGIVLWIGFYIAHVHTTLAGVLLGICWPYYKVPRQSADSLAKLHDQLYPWVSFLIVPLFVFANAGVSFFGGSSEPFSLSILSIAIAVALFIGKPLGIFSVTYTAVRLKLAHLPEGASWRKIYGVAALAGIGFTMSLYLSTLAFPGVELSTVSRIGILVGSFASAVYGILLLHKL